MVDLAVVAVEEVDLVEAVMVVTVEAVSVVDQADGMTEVVAVVEEASVAGKNKFYCFNLYRYIPSSMLSLVVFECRLEEVLKKFVW
ncbi:hypothetical protein Y032_0281g1245 [Ancylostoma ceylanicum]|uniref:Uncharacterized protein n=1 Tax=Ancylostoma ceylanicum TaxID=53326 RepID=A0A016S6K9_9BILA|nr:hypothetical protein Y032_0281g1245 [Ancylostoma ceylanicum]